MLGMVVHDDDVADCDTALRRVSIPRSQRLADLAGGLRADAPDPLEYLFAPFPHRVTRAAVAQQITPPGRTDAGDPTQFRRKERPASATAAGRARETVGLPPAFV